MGDKRKKLKHKVQGVMSLQMLAGVSHKKSRTSNPNLSQEVFENSLLFDGNEAYSAKVRGLAPAGIKSGLDKEELPRQALHNSGGIQEVNDDQLAENRLLSPEDVESLRREIVKRIRTPERLVTAFVKLDKNKDGLLSKKEFKVMIGILAKGANDTRITSTRGILEIWKAIWGGEPFDASAKLTQDKLINWVFPSDKTAHDL